MCTARQSRSQIRRHRDSRTVQLRALRASAVEQTGRKECNSALLRWRFRRAVTYGGGSRMRPAWLVPRKTPWPFVPEICVRAAAGQDHRVVSSERTRLVVARGEERRGPSVRNRHRAGERARGEVELEFQEQPFVAAARFKKAVGEKRGGQREVRGHDEMERHVVRLVPSTETDVVQPPMATNLPSPCVTAR
jgi:hypothetical protein